MGRPKASNTRRICPIRLTEAEREVIQERADLAFLTVSEYMRRCALGKRIQTRSDVKTVAELKRLGGLQKHLVMNDPNNRDAYNKVISEIVGTLRVLQDDPGNAK